MLGGRNKISQLPSPLAGPSWEDSRVPRKLRVTWGHRKDSALPRSPPGSWVWGCPFTKAPGASAKKPSPAEGNQALFPLPGAPCCSQDVWVPQCS